jgi:hypothetical protein
MEVKLRKRGDFEWFDRVSVSGFRVVFFLVTWCLGGEIFCVRDSSGKPTAGINYFHNQFSEDLKRIGRPDAGRARPKIPQIN